MAATGHMCMTVTRAVSSDSAAVGLYITGCMSTTQNSVEASIKYNISIVLNMTPAFTVSILLLVAAALLQATEVLRINKTIIAPLVIQGDSSGTCPSTGVRLTTIERIQNVIKSNIPVVARKCGDGLWYRVAHLNMSDPSEQCPSAWTRREYGINEVRACGRPVFPGGRCSGTFYTTGHQYSKVCGRVIGYQKGHPDVFQTGMRGIDQIYIDGISITHGSPRNHIWSYVGAFQENVHVPNACPCSYSFATRPPSFVGDNYYCESGNPTSQNPASTLYSEDKLWDGQQCEHEGSCCTTKSPPWFSIELPNTTANDMEVRICGTESIAGEDTPVELLELYVQ